MLARSRNAGFGPQDRIVVGFSGGRDSLALAAALRWAQGAAGIAPLLVHVDHRLRRSSGDDATRAADLARALDMEFRAVAVAATPTNLHLGVGLEEAARRERYRILFEIAAQHGAAAVATAHHQGDQAETVLLHLLRGGGVHGAAGMAERSPAPITDSYPSQDISPEQRDAETWLWRPLLDEPRAVIDAYVHELGLEPTEDPSNDDTSLRRNALRHDLLPALERLFPGASTALARYAALAAEDDRALADIALAARADMVDPGGRLAVAPLWALPLAIQRRVIRSWLVEATSSRTLTAERTDAVLALAQRGSGGKGLEIGEGWTVRLQRGMLRAERTGSPHEEDQ